MELNQVTLQRHNDSRIHFEVDLFARPIVGMCTRYHKGPISQ
ncbi:hypothetical protein GQ55_9G268900 [Panicum hallii var. hallii]|uniref:Uncharacterized protein n=6 Tax=Liliopsida TaxID=4447 RepID=A0A368PE24_SETIT|nr:hypothetical protein PVAP13_J039336 [Panicum virgatum]PUZ39220.1 hypothetical protein GQ55_9G268900 [Panicum hallii var. hallii]RCU61488.1 hypothetical protein SETIT_J006000v2 [Setaria italica]TKW38943.1 hypothetical protein SEVIR_1G145641v2 [Setaria viridis]CAA2630174.1 unnamed protein product [Spirodela intermedia]